MGRKYLPLYAFLLIGWLGLLYCNTPAKMVAGDGIIRLHVKANSNNASDQGVKLAVRDAVVNYLTLSFQQVSSPEEARAIIMENKTMLSQIADGVIKEHGGTYQSEIQLGHYDFPTKAYGNMVLPAGRYEAVRIILGTGTGDNWWCVLFPPLCFMDVPGATKEEQTPGIQFRWKLAELWAKTQQ